MIAIAVHWANGMVTVFGAAGEQLPQYQGRYEDVRERILRLAPATTRFQQGSWAANVLVDVPRASW